MLSAICSVLCLRNHGRPVSPGMAYSHENSQAANRSNTIFNKHSANMTLHLKHLIYFLPCLILNFCKWCIILIQMLSKYSFSSSNVYIFCMIGVMVVAVWQESWGFTICIILSLYGNPWPNGKVLCKRKMLFISQVGPLCPFEYCKQINNVIIQLKVLIQFCDILRFTEPCKGQPQTFLSHPNANCFCI